MTDIKAVLLLILGCSIFPIIIFIIDKIEKNIKLSNKKKRLEAEEKDRRGRAKKDAFNKRREEILNKLILFLETQKSKTELILGDNFDEEVLLEAEILAVFNDGYFKHWEDEFETTLAKVLKEGGVGAIPSDKQSILSLLEKCRVKLKWHTRMVQDEERESTQRRIQQILHNKNISRNSNG